MLYNFAEQHQIFIWQFKRIRSAEFNGTISSFVNDTTYIAYTRHLYDFVIRPNCIADCFTISWMFYHIDTVLTYIFVMCFETKWWWWWWYYFVSHLESLLFPIFKGDHSKISIGTTKYKTHAKSYVCLEQNKSAIYHIEMYESTPFVELIFQATVPIRCPGCSLIIPIISHVGLTLSTCSLTFSCTDTNTTLRVRAVPTPGSNARIMSLKFGSTKAACPPWDGYTLDQISVHYFIWLLLFVYYCRVQSSL